jgi:DNA-binding transcriptional MerR regulator
MGISVKRYSTVEVARLVRVHKLTLLRWLYSNKIPEPRRVRVNHQQYRIWSQADLERVRQFKKANYRKKPRRKKAGRTKAKRSKS